MKNKVTDIAKQVIRLEEESLAEMSSRINGDFNKAVEIILQTKGRVVVIGVGKSGIIGKKIAATLASTGTPSFFVHPSEAYHGDLGMIKPIDCALLISNSGETEEVIRLIPFLQYQGNQIISVTGNLKSSLAQHSHAVLDVSVKREACNNNLAPTCSTTTTLVMGDALAVTLSTLRNFQPEDFARFHPGGSLGRRLLTKVKDVMRTKDLPICRPDSSMKEIVHTVSSGRMGIALVVDNEILCGVITDGDLCRSFERYEKPMQLLASHVMTKSPQCIAPQESFSSAEEKMHRLKIKALAVVDCDNRVLGVVGVFDV